MTGSSEFASLRQAYTWTCSMFVPPGQTIKGVKFNRNNVLLAVIGYFNNDCANQSANPRYTYRCLSDYVYTLTIPAENMTEYEQGSLWRCEYMFDSSYRSSDVIIKIASKIYFKERNRLRKRLETFTNVFSTPIGFFSLSNRKSLSNPFSSYRPCKFLKFDKNTYNF